MLPQVLLALSYYELKVFGKSQVIILHFILKQHSDNPPPGSADWKNDDLKIEPRVSHGAARSIFAAAGKSGAAGQMCLHSNSCQQVRSRQRLNL